MTQATPQNYWISPNALYIELNAMGNPDYIQASCVSGAQILVYVKDVISYDAGHNYRRWTLQASPTVFLNHTEKYVYAAIPRNNTTNDNAMIVFPSEEIDIYGKNASEEQIGSTDYFYIFLQGVLTSSGDNGTESRDWKQRFVTGYLSSDEAIAAGSNDSEWYKYSSVDQTTTFLKKLTMKVGTFFKELFVYHLSINNGGSVTFESKSGIISGIASSDTAISSETDIVTPKYLDDNSLSSVNNDTARGLIKFLKGISLGTNYSISELGDAILRTIQGKGYTISEDGDVVFRDMVSPDYDYASQSGYGMKRREDGKFQLSLTDLEVWGRAVFHELEIRKLSYVGGNFIFSPAGSKLMHVKEVKVTMALDGSSVTTGYKCYFLADDGTTATENMWKVGDLAYSQSFNIKKGVYENVSNRKYWRKVTAVSSENEQITDADGNILYDGQKFGWITLGNTFPGTNYEKGSDAPQAGDAVCCLGNVSDEERQNAIEIQTVGALAPAIIQYGGISTFSLTDCVKTQISPKGNKFVGDFSMVTSSGDEKDVLETVTTLQTDVNGIHGTVASLSEKVSPDGNQMGSLEMSVSEIRQTADSISLKVDQQSVRGRNLIPQSYFFITSSIYGVGQRKFTLESGKYYSLSVNGHVDAALKNNGGVLRAFIFDAAWTPAKCKHLDISSLTDVTETLKGFTVPSTGEYYFSVYPFHESYNGSMPQENGTVTLNWAQLEEGGVCSPWSLNEGDPAIEGNMLPSLADDKWSRLGDILTDALDTGSRKLPALHYKNTGSTEADVLYMNNGITPESGQTYTLSFWAKGSGTLKSFLYPEACSKASDNFGQVGISEDGSLSRTLTSSWQRIRIAYCTKQLFGNYFYNAGFNDSSSSTAWKNNWDYNGLIYRVQSAVDGWNAVYARKQTTSQSYCEISQAVGASLFAGWWTLTAKIKCANAVRIFLAGISFSTIDNSGMTVCVDGENQSVKTSDGVAYVDLPASSSAYTEHSITFKVSSALSSARIYFRSYTNPVYIAKPMLTPSPQKSGFSTREQGTAKNILPCRLLSGGEVWIGGVKLEPGGRMTDYTEEGVSVETLLATGIDILNKRVIVTADKFQIRNNKGEETFSVDESGRVTMVNVDFGGMINKQAVDIKQLSDLQSLFECHHDDFEGKDIFYCAKLDKMYGIYNINYDIPAAGYAMDLCLPSLYVDINGDWSAGGISDDFYLADSDVPPEKIMKAVRSMIGNKVVIYNDSTGDVKIQGVTNYMHDVWEKSSSSTSAAKSAAVAVQSSSASTQANTTTTVSTPWTDGSLSGPTYLDTPWNQELGRYLGRERDWGTWTLNGGKHNFVVMECLCEVDIRGNECIYWSVMYGRGMGFK